MKIKIGSADGENLTVRMRGIPQEFSSRTDFRKFGGLLAVRAVRRNFTARRSADGSTWPPLKVRVGGVPFHGQGGRMAKGVTSRPTAKGFMVAAGEATRDFNAAHNFGSKMWWNSGRRKGNPKREYMYLSKDAAAEIAAEMRGWVRRRLERRGR